MGVLGLHLGGRIDRYVTRLFVLSYLAAFALVVGLFLIMDMAVNVDDFLRPDDQGESPSFLMVAQYYALQVPFLYLQVSPYVTLVAGMFTAAKMTRAGEVVAALDAGVSVRRLFAPVLLGAVLLAAGMFALRELATEELGARRDALQDRLEEKREHPVLENFFVYARSGEKVYLREYRAGGEGRSAEVLGLSCHFRRGDRSVSVFAQRATPLERGTWALEGADRHEAGPDRFERSTPEVLDDVRFTTGDIELSYKGRKHPMELSFSESEVLLLRDPTNVQYRTLFHYHVTFPLAGLVLLLVGLPFALRQERGKAGERIAIGFLLCVGYFGVEFISRTLGLQGHLGPMLASWFPVVGFGALGLVLFGGQRT